MDKSKMVIDKKQKRAENKRKKLCALLAVTQLNENDKKNICPSSEKDSASDNLENGCSVSKKPKNEDTSEEQSTMNSEENSTEQRILYLDDMHKELEKKDAESLKVVEQRIFSKRYKPKLIMKTPGMQSSLSTYISDRVPILITDIQHLLLNSIIGHQSPYLPLRWCSLEKSNHISHTVVIIAENLSLYDFCTWENYFELNEQLPYRLEVVTPSIYNGSLIDELAIIPITDLEKESLIEQYGNMETAMESRKDLMIMMRAVFPVYSGMRPNSMNDKIQDNFSRTQLVLSAWQLIEGNYPLPLQGKLKTSYFDYVMTKDVYEPVMANSPLFGIDCEMCQTERGLELTRISVVNENFDIIYETFVLPFNKITNYLTQFSGITENTLLNVQTRLKDVQNALREILPADAILVGQSLNFDLHALKMMHPYIIDTSVIFNTTGTRSRKTKLKLLAKLFLKQTIQEGNKGHCSVEDAITSLKLVKLKLSKHLAFGDVILKSKQNPASYDHLKTKSTEYVSNIFNQVIPKNKSCLIVGSDGVISNYSKYLSKLSDSTVHENIKIMCKNDNKNIVESVSDNYNTFSLTLAHLYSNLKISNQENFTNLNIWMKNIWNNLETKSLVMLILAGNESCNGAAFIGIKI